MIVRLALVVAIVVGGGANAAPLAAQPVAPDCTEWHACRDLALAAVETGDYRGFHDLAWRAVQLGPVKDAPLMYLLARAQALSGRSHDALIMLQRLSDMGTVFDALTNDDFKRTRELDGWAELEARLTGIAAGSVRVPPVTSTTVDRRAPPRTDAPALTAPTPSPARPLAGPASMLAVTTLAAASETIHFSARRFAVSGVAYDAVSRRFVLGDRSGRKLMVVDERSSQPVDLIGTSSGGFLDIAAVDIDAKRGDLWVASTDAAGASGTLHRLHLGSGRPLRALRIGDEQTPAMLLDLAIAPAGGVLVLDSVRLLLFRPSGTAVEPVAPLEEPDPVSVAAADDSTAFVAHRDGRLSKIDLRSRTVSLVTGLDGLSLATLERIRPHHQALVAVQLEAGGTRRILRLEMNARRTAIVKVTRLEVPVPITADTFVTVSGDELVLLTAGDRHAGESSLAGSADGTQFAVYRVPLP